MNYTTLKGVPIFRPGQRRGEDYPPERLRQMVRNSNAARKYFRGVIKTKLTHAAQQPDLLSQAALGQSVRYYLKPGPGGPFVVADFDGVPEPIAQAAPHHFPNVSVEKYRVFDSGDGFRAPDVIKSVAFLGADAPEVKGLKMAFPEVFTDSHGEVELFQMGATHMLGPIIKKIREELAMSVEDLAGVVGKTPEELNQIEAGQLEPDEATLQAIADALGVTVEDLQKAAAAEQPEEGNTPTPSPSAEGSKPAQFSEADVKQLVALAVAEAVKPLKAQITNLAAKAHKTAAELFAERQAAKTNTIRAKIDAWKAKGMPAVLENLGLETFMAKLDDKQVEQFAEAEGGSQTPLAWFANWVEKFQELGPVELRELAPADAQPRGKQPATLAAAVEMYKEQPEHKDTPYQDIWQLAAASYPNLVVNQ